MSKIFARLRRATFTILPRAAPLLSFCPKSTPRRAFSVLTQIGRTFRMPSDYAKEIEPHRAEPSERFYQPPPRRDTPSSPGVPKVVMEVACPPLVVPLALRLLRPPRRRQVAPRRPPRLCAPAVRHRPLPCDEAKEGEPLAREHRRHLVRYSDRIVVFFGGDVFAVVDAATTSGDDLGHLIGGRRR